MREGPYYLYGGTYYCGDNTYYDFHYFFSTCSNVHYDCDKHPVWVPTPSAVWAKTGRSEYIALDCEMLTVRAPPEPFFGQTKGVLAFFVS